MHGLGNSASQERWHKEAKKRELMERVSFRHRGLTETPVSGDQLPLSEATAARELERQECRVSGAFEVEGVGGRMCLA